MDDGRADATQTDDVTAGNLQELRRGTVVLAALVALREPSYGYALLDHLSERGMPVDANTLYPLLRRLEKQGRGFKQPIQRYKKQGLLESEWNTDEARPRKFYVTTRDGESLAVQLSDEWARLDGVVRSLTARPQTTEGDTP